MFLNSRSSFISFNAFGLYSGALVNYLKVRLKAFLYASRIDISLGLIQSNHRGNTLLGTLLQELANIFFSSARYQYFILHGTNALFQLLNSNIIKQIICTSYRSHVNKLSYLCVNKILPTNKPPQTDGRPNLTCGRILLAPALLNAMCQEIFPLWLLGRNMNYSHPFVSSAENSHCSVLVPSP